MSERRTLTIESNYCENWTIQDAIREIIQNGLDADDDVEIVARTLDSEGMWAVVDHGSGLKPSDFIIGKSSKRDDQSVIGQFGEGLKIGCLVFAREQRKVTILSLGKRYDFSIQYDEAWQDNLLTIDINEYPTEDGTAVLMDCTKDEIESAQALFLKLNPQPVTEHLASSKTDIIGGSPGIIWVNGLAVSRVDSLFGYNFSQKDLVNRDRSAIGYGQIKDCIGRALGDITSMGIIQHMLMKGVEAGESGATYTEFDMTFYPRKNTWLKAVRALYGNRVCVSSNNPAEDLAAVEKGWRVLHLPWSFRYSMSRILPLSADVVKDTTKIVPRSRLTAAQREFLAKGKEIADEIAEAAGLQTYPVKVFVDEDKKSSPFFKQEGYYQDGFAGVCRDVINEQDLGNYVGILLHEYTHGTCGHDDNSRAFENDLTNVVASLGLALVSEKAKGRQAILKYGLKRTVDNQRGMC